MSQVVCYLIAYCIFVVLIIHYPKFSLFLFILATHKYTPLFYLIKSLITAFFFFSYHIVCTQSIFSILVY